MSLTTHTVSAGQSLLDIALQRYGNAESVTRILELNPSIEGYGASLEVGQILLYDQGVTNQISRLFERKDYVVNMDQKTMCQAISPVDFVLNWDSTWDGTIHKVAFVAIAVEGLLQSAVFTEDFEIYDQAGNYLAASNPSNTPNIYDNFVTANPAYGQPGVPGEFGFLPGTYTISLEFDQVTLIDGTTCSYILELEISWAAGASAPTITSFDYVLPVTF